jgi:transposase
MRASYDTLFRKAKEILEQDPLSGHLFVFVNAGRSSCKCLYYDGTGLVIIAKRLERGGFSRINPLFSREVVLTPAEFSLFFEGAALHKRFIDSPPEHGKISLSKERAMLKNSSNENLRNTEASFS